MSKELKRLASRVHEHLGERSDMRGVKDMIMNESRNLRSSTHAKCQRSNEDASEEYAEAQGAGRQP
jgi:hypothetical protein